MQVYQVLRPVEHGVDVSLAQNDLTGGGPCQQRLPVELWGKWREGHKWREVGGTGGERGYLGERGES